jgi:hypothetical protein
MWWWWWGEIEIERQINARFFFIVNYKSGVVVVGGAFFCSSLLVGSDRYFVCRSLIFCLEEVIGRTTRHMRLAAPRGRIELEETVSQLIVQLHDGGLIATAVAVVRRRENGDDIAIVAPIVTLHHQLMGTRY